jgi:hypothetical protein
LNGLLTGITINRSDVGAFSASGWRRIVEDDWYSPNSANAVT